MGYCIGKPWWGQGYTTEALNAVLSFAFGTMGLNRVETVHISENIASGRVMQKAGMTHEGTFRQWKCRKGKFCDYESYGILKQDWERLNGL